MQNNAAAQGSPRGGRSSTGHRTSPWAEGSPNCLVLPLASDYKPRASESKADFGRSRTTEHGLQVKCSHIPNNEYSRRFSVVPGVVSKCFNMPMSEPMRTKFSSWLKPPYWLKCHCCWRCVCVQNEHPSSILLKIPICFQSETPKRSH